MDISIQGTTNSSINDVYTKYTFKKGGKFEKDRHNIMVKSQGKEYGITKGLGNIELVQDINLIIHVKPNDESELEFIYSKIKSPDVYLSLGRHEDLVDIKEVSIEECKLVDEMETKVPIYIPLDIENAYGTIYNLPKKFSINKKNGLRQFDELIKVSLHNKGKELEDVYQDSYGYPVILC